MGSGETHRVPAINGFRGPYRFLSNCFVEPDGTHVEGEYQAAKCRHEKDVRRFEGLIPSQAKRLGQVIEVRADWDAMRLDIMHGLVAQKFADHPRLTALLRDTGSAYLEETNTWYDTFWGVCRGEGDNYLGHILMDIRGSLR